MSFWFKYCVRKIPCIIIPFMIHLNKEINNSIINREESLKMQRLSFVRIFFWDANYDQLFLQKTL